MVTVRKIKIDLKEFVFSALAVAYLFVSSSVIIRSNKIDNIIQLCCLFFMLMLYLLHKRGTIHKNKSYICLAGFLFLSVAASLLIGDTTGMIQSSKYFINLLYFVILTEYFQYERKIPEFMITAMIAGAVLIAIQCLILFILVYFDSPISFQQIYNENAGSFYRNADFYLGYANNIHSKASGSLLRVCSFFQEPSKLTKFLYLPMFLSMGRYKKRGQMRYLLGAYVIFATEIVTFSRAGYLCIASAVLFYLFFSDRKGTTCTEKRDILRFVILSIFAIALLLLILKGLDWYSLVRPDSRLSAIFDRGANQNNRDTISLIRSTSNYGLIFEALLKQPLGYGLGWTDTSREMFNNPSAFGVWLYSSGFLVLFPIAAFFIHIGIKYCIPCLKSKSPMKIAVAMAFIATFIHDISYGTWFAILDMHVLAMLIVIKDKRQEEKPVSL